MLKFEGTCLSINRSVWTCPLPLSLKLTKKSPTCRLPDIFNCRGGSYWNILSPTSSHIIPHVPVCKGNTTQVMSTYIWLCISISSIGVPAYVNCTEYMESNPPPLLKKVSHTFIVVYDLCLSLIHTMLLWMIWFQLKTSNLAICGIILLPLALRIIGYTPNYTWSADSWAWIYIPWVNTVSQYFSRRLFSVWRHGVTW